MKTDYDIDSFAAEDIESAVKIWKAVFPDNFLSSETLRKYTLDHRGFDPEALSLPKILSSLLSLNLRDGSSRLLPVSHRGTVHL